MEIKCTEEELWKIQTALDFYVRMQIGQYDNIEDYMRWNKVVDRVDHVSDQVTGLLLIARNTVFPKLNRGLSGSIGLSGCFGVFSQDRPVKGGIAYDIYQEVRYKRSYFLRPEGGWTVDFDRPLWCDDDPCPRPEASLWKEGSTDYAKLKVCKEQKDVIVDALKVYAMLCETKLRKMLVYFTDDKYALDTMQCVEDIYRDIPYDENCHDDDQPEKYLKLAESIEGIASTTCE